MTAGARSRSDRRRPSPQYLFHLAIAIIGIAALSVALGGELRIRSGLDATDALNHEGAVAFALALSLGYVSRLIFWDRVQPRYQALTRNVLSLILCVELALAIVTIFFVTTSGSIKPVGGESSTGTVMWFTIPGVLCQISTVIWLLRYRRE